MYDIAGDAHRRRQSRLAGRPAAGEPARGGGARNLLAAGATIIGKTICDEFFYSVTGVNAHYGTPTNVRAPGRLPGGSSSGSAAATAAGACDFALGCDTGGSVRIPASLCGLYGLRATHGRVDPNGAMEMSPLVRRRRLVCGQSPGVFRRVGAVLLGGDAERPPVTRLIVADDGFRAKPTAGRGARAGRVPLGAGAPRCRAARRSRRAGGFDDWREALRIIQAHELWQSYGHFVTERDRASGRASRSGWRSPRRVTAAERRRAHRSTPRPATHAARCRRAR